MHVKTTDTDTYRMIDHPYIPMSEVLHIVQTLISDYGPDIKFAMQINVINSQTALMSLA